VASNASGVRFLRPGFRLTNEATKRLLLQITFASWNVRFTPIQCCELHCLTEDAQRLVKSMHHEPCSSVCCDLDWQCGGCGILDAGMVDDNDGSCALCGHIASLAEHSQLQSTGLVHL